MRLHDLKPAAGSHRERKRLGRGNSAGQGTTAGKGTKGEKARSGGLKAGFRGMSSRNFRLAKRRGFTNRFKIEYQPINVSRLSAAFEAGATVDLDALRSAGLVRGRKAQVKILGDGEIAIALHIAEIKVSRAARQKIEAAGGSVLTDDDASSPVATAAPSSAQASEAPAVEAPVPEATAPAVALAAPAAPEAAAPEPATTEPPRAETPAADAAAARPARRRTRAAAPKRADEPDATGPADATPDKEENDASSGG